MPVPAPPKPKSKPAPPKPEPVANLYTVTQVMEGSPAEKYVKEGDLILGIDGHLFKTSQSLDVLYGPCLLYTSDIPSSPALSLKPSGTGWTDATGGR